MNEIDDAWVPFNDGTRVQMGKALLGQLIYLFDGRRVLIGSQPGEPHTVPPLVEIDLVSFRGRTLGSMLDEEGEGVAVDYTIEVKAGSAYDPAIEEERQAGDFLTNGHYAGVYATTESGKPSAVTIFPSVAVAPMVAYAEWRIVVNGQTAFVKIDV